jgi:hypothetical protein
MIARTLPYIRLVVLPLYNKINQKQTTKNGKRKKRKMESQGNNGEWSPKGTIRDPTTENKK